jgi:polyisoprenoid-binding protein YceI
MLCNRAANRHMMKTIIYIGALLFMVLGVFAQGTSRVVDYASSMVTFKIKNAGIGVDGSFKEYTATVQFDPKNLGASHIEGKIKTKSINTGINGRDNHLRKEEFFNVDKYPEINFKSTTIKQQGAVYLITGKLTIKDVTKEVSLPLKQSQNGTLEVYESSLTINRLDYHVGEDSWTMSDEVLITIKITTK